MGIMDGKVAIISGGASGLGKASGLLMAREGASIVITDINDDAGQGVADEIEGGGGKALYFNHDVAIEADWERVIAATIESLGRLDVVVNNAGIGDFKNVEETSVADWRHMMAINADGVFLGTKHAILAMKEQRSGSIINISSIEGIIGDPDLAAYNASKGAVRIFTKSSALHCGKKGYNIRVNSIHPGYIRTPLLESAMADMGDAQEVEAYVAGLHPIGHLGEPYDIANGVLYLASDMSKFVTGTELVIDGGYTAQ